LEKINIIATKIIFDESKKRKTSVYLSPLYSVQRKEFAKILQLRERQWECQKWLCQRVFKVIVNRQKALCFIIRF